MYTMRMSLSRGVLAIALALVLLGPTVSAQVPGEVADSLTQLNYRFFDRPVDPASYLIRPGEQLLVTFVGAKLPNLGLVVNADGKIASPTLGLFDMGGKTLAQARAELMPVLSNFYTADEISISVGEPMRTAISVTGEVVRPGLYLAYTSQLVSEVLELAGGVTGYGSRRHIVLSGGPEDIPVDLDRAIYLGDALSDPPVYGGYRIDVPQRTDRVVNIVGLVRHPREIELIEGDSLFDLLAMAGGVRRNGDASRLYIVGDSLRDPRQPANIQARDVIMVPKRDGSNTAGVLIIFGQIARPGRYTLDGAPNLLNLLNRAGGMTPDANDTRITVFRRAEDDSRQLAGSERYPIRVGADSNVWSQFQLQSGDSVFVPITVGFVRVSGEVRHPGLVPYEDGRSAAYYIETAGGFLDSADRARIVTTDRISGLTSTHAPDVGVRDGDEVRVNRKEVLR